MAKHYQEESSVKLSRERTRQVIEQLKQKQDQPPTDSMEEVELAIRQLKCKKAPGPDGVTNDTIKNFGLLTNRTMFKLFNESWKTGTVPVMWEKSYNHSYTQTGYRKYRSTDDQLALIAHEIENAFQEKKKVVAVFFDLTKAVDKVWREGLLLKVLQSRVSGRMYKWIRCFLQERSARVKLDGYMSESVKMREGVPQGCVILPTFFLLYINNITTIIPRHVSNTLHADDFAVWSAADHTTSAAYRIQEAVTRIQQWTDKWGLQISKLKTQATVNFLATLKEKITLKLGDRTPK